MLAATVRTLIDNQRRDVAAGVVVEPPTFDLSFYNAKKTDPSTHVLPPDGRSRRCSWLENGLSIHADGNVTCGLDDPYGRRSFGNIHRQPLSEIWANPEYQRLIDKLWAGHRCAECHMGQEAEIPPPARPMRPTTLVVEPTIRCNLRCAQPACVPNNAADIRTRDTDFLHVDRFEQVMEELAGRLSHVFFYNYGDPFVHAGSPALLRALARTNPRARVETSTNGAPLSNMARAREVVAAGALDQIVFTIGGVRQEAYERYHVGGRVDVALKGLRNVLQARRELGVSGPTVIWRYLLFNWNDSEAEIEEAIRLTEEYGVDHLSLYLTHVPTSGLSHRFSPGGPLFARYRWAIENSLGYSQHSPSTDADGFYHIEASGPAAERWSGWQARRDLTVRSGTARLAVSTSRPATADRIDHVLLRTPWQVVKAPLAPNVWRSVELRAPESGMQHLPVEILCRDHWYPAEELSSTDMRCLGVRVLESEEAAWAMPPFRDSAGLTEADRAALDSWTFEPVRPLVDW